MRARLYALVPLPVTAALLSTLAETAINLSDINASEERVTELTEFMVKYSGIKSGAAIEKGDS